MTTKRALIGLALLSLYLSFANYGDWGNLTSGDAGYRWAIPWETTQHLASLFVSGHGLGFNGSPSFCAITLTALLSLLSLITGSSAIADRIMVAIMFFLAYSGAYLLVKRLLAGRGPRTAIEIGACAAAAIYGANHYTAFGFASAVYDLPLVYVLLPWVVLTFLDSAQGRTREAIALGISVFLLGSAVGARIITVLIVALATMFATLLDPATRTRTLRCSFPLFVLCLAVSTWWGFPYLTVVSSGLSSLHAMDTTSWLRWMSERSSLAHVYKLDGYTGGDHFNWAWWYRSPVINFLGYAPVGLALVGLGRRRPLFGTVIFALGFIGLILTTGVHEVSGPIYAWMIDHLPGFSIFRSPYDKWIPLPALAFAVLGGIGASLLAQQPISPRGRRMIPAFIFLPLMLYPLPQYMGKLVYPFDGKHSFVTTIPPDYRQAAQAVSQGNDAVALFNTGAAPYQDFDWTYFGVEDPLESLVHQRLSPVTDLIPDAASMAPKLLAKRLRDFGIGWIIVHHDILNPVASPSIDALVHAKEAEPVLLTTSLLKLSVYRLRGAPAPLARIVRSLAAPLGDSVDDFSGRRYLESASYALDNARVADLLLKTPREAFGDAREAVFVPAWAGTGWEWPLIAQPISCGKNAGVRIAAPILWKLGATTISPQPWQACTTQTALGELQIDGTDTVSPLFFLTSASHRIAMLTLPPAASTTHIRRFQEQDRLASAILTSDVTADRLHVTWRPDCPSSLNVVLPNFSASLSAPNRDVRFPTPLAAGSSILMYAVNDVTCGGWPLSELLLLSDDPDFSQPIGTPLTLPERLFRFPHPLPARGVANNLDQYRKALLAEIQGFTGRPGVPGNVFLLHGGDVSGWSDGESTPGFLIDADGDTPFSLAAGIGLDPSSRYQLTVEYTTEHDAEISLEANGTYETHGYTLPADEHRATFLIAPPPNVLPAFVVHVTAYQGKLRVRHVRFTPIGPNGLWVSRITPSDRPARLNGIERPLPGVIRLQLSDCAPCTVRVNVADTPNWRFFGAHLLASGIGPGGATGAWSLFSTGSSVWRIDAGTGDRTVTIVYRPLLFTGVGIIVTLSALLIALLWRHVTTDTVLSGIDAEHAETPFVAGARFATMLLVACGAFLASAFPKSAAESAAFSGVTLGMLVLLAAVCRTQRAR